MPAKRKPTATTRKAMPKRNVAAATKKTTAKKATAKKTSPVRKTSTVPLEDRSFQAMLVKIRKTLKGTKVHVLSIPWEAKDIAKMNGATWQPELKQFIYEGNILPVALEPYRSLNYSLERWVEEELNGTRTRIPRPASFMKPRKHQQTAIKRIMSACKAGWRGFVLADTTGLGKSLEAIIAAYAVAQIKGFTPDRPANVLIMAPKAVVPHWRNTVLYSGVDSLLRIVVINYDQSKKLLDEPASAVNAARTRTKNKNTALYGTPTIKWDIILSDEAHKLKNISQRSNSFNKIARYGDTPEKAPFIIWLSATIGQNPLELGYLAPLVAQITGTRGITMKEWGKWLISQGYHVTESTGGSFNWVQIKKDATPEQKEEAQEKMNQDILRLSELLFSESSPSIRRRPQDIAGWPEQTLIPLPIQLNHEENKQYLAAWNEFRKYMHLHPRGKNPAGGLAATLRFQQKSSLLTAGYTADYATDLLENGLQVAISVKFIETLDALKQTLEKKGYTVVEFSGRNTDVREQERLRFQRGEAQVIIFTVVEGISLHANELLPDGTHASAAERALLVHDMRYSGIEMVQINGRTHRDGENSNAWYMYTENTIEEKILHTMLRRMKNMDTLQGDNTEDEIYAILDAA